MCGRFTLDLPPELLAELFNLGELCPLLSRFNIAPTQPVAVVRADLSGIRSLALLQWGLIPSWSRDRGGAARMINARSETAADKAAFRQALKLRRCIVPASGFYEWRREGKAKVPHYVTLRDKAPMALAALWESWRSPEGEVVESCTILTTDANPLVEPLHSRMPAILAPADWDRWLDRGIRDSLQVTPLLTPYPAELMQQWEVSSLVNSVQNDSPALVERREAVMSLFD
ncbi:DUF159 family protein [Geomonas sp. Red276]